MIVPWPGSGQSLLAKLCGLLKTKSERSDQRNWLRSFRLGLQLLATCMLGGCEGVQSALAPAGPQAEAIHRLTWILFGGGAAIFALVLALTAVAGFTPERARAWLAHRRTIIIGGIVFPIVTLSALLISSLWITRAFTGEPAATAHTVEIIGERWWWRVFYLDEHGRRLFESANEIRMPIGTAVRFVLRSADVIHSFWVPRLGGKLDMIPGRTNSLVLSAAQPGIYRGQCAEFCGAQHALMSFYVVGLQTDEFDAWFASNRTPAKVPITDLRQYGLSVFLRVGCGGCHTIRGTQANGTIGPDLTHVGGRLSIGAGYLSNRVGPLAAWIASAQHLKPDNLMPSFNNLTGAELRAVAAYLEGLE